MVSIFSNFSFGFDFYFLQRKGRGRKIYGWVVSADVEK